MAAEAMQPSSNLAGDSVSRLQFIGQVAPPTDDIGSAAAAVATYEVETSVLDNYQVEASAEVGNEVNGLTGLLVAETEVTNGFVKDGSSLPYVFEANDSGNRKRSTKILPVCGMCGKKFVCVTTMKRHLVTHTGEKPFSCKVCGKQYTQKGNLRVHERTHRNDRPFQCNICHQKFYRKEPMQKHQWRQHGIVHFKSRPTNSAANNNINNNNSQPSLGIIGAEGVLYSTLNQRILEDAGRPEVAEAEVVLPVPVDTLDNIPISYVVETTKEVEVREEEVKDEQPQPAGNSAHYLTPAPEFAPVDRIEVPEALEETVVTTSEHVQEQEQVVAEVAVEPEAEETNRPIKLKMKLAQAYMKEIEENREREERREEARSGRDFRREEIPQGRDFRLQETLTAPLPRREEDIGRIDNNFGDIRLSSGEESSTATITTDSNPNSRPHSRIPDQVSLEAVVTSQPELRQKESAILETQEDKESLQFQCKSCGTRCLVPDPYSFRCPTCNMKYTSLPTHMIADPLQCIGCTEVFAHKPALKLHQSSEDKERPFKCCRCGFEFRQKAHLQKHQWRIHRKKFEADTGVREAEALLSVVEDVAAVARAPSAAVNPSTGYAPNVRGGGVEGMKPPAPLDLSPAKMYGTAGSITKWVEQVETARTPIIPDISIHKKSTNNAAPPQDLTRFKELLAAADSGIHQQKDKIQFHIVNTLSGRQEDTLTISLLEPPPPSSALPSDSRPIAYRSRPPPLESNNPAVVQPSWKNVEQTENPLLNQIVGRDSVAGLNNAAPLPQQPSASQPSSLSISRATKRPRKEVSTPEPPFMPPSDLPTDLRVREPSSMSLEARLRSPLSLNTSPLRLTTEYSTVSPPLNLSSTSNLNQADGQQVSPYDYRIGKSSGLISGHFQRLKSQDERSGI